MGVGVTAEITGVGVPAGTTEVGVTTDATESVATTIICLPHLLVCPVLWCQEWRQEPCGHCEEVSGEPIPEEKCYRGRDDPLTVGASCIEVRWACGLLAPHQ